DGELTSGPIAQAQEHSIDMLEGLRCGIEGANDELSFQPPGTSDVADAQVLRELHWPAVSPGLTPPGAAVAAFRSSGLSRRALYPSRWAAAASSVRMAFTVLPSRPITFPTSSGATWSSKVKPPSALARRSSTCSGLSTRDLARYLMSDSSCADSDK